MCRTIYPEDELAWCFYWGNECREIIVGHHIQAKDYIWEAILDGADKIILLPQKVAIMKLSFDKLPSEAY